MDEALSQLSSLVDSFVADAGQSESSVEQAKAKMAELQHRLRSSREAAVQGMHLLQSSSSNLLSKYYWVVFIVMYAGVYLWQ